MPLACELQKQAGTLALPSTGATFPHRAGLTQCENRGFALDFYLRSGVVAGRNFSRNRFGTTGRLSPEKWPAGVSIADFERTIRASHQNGVVQDSGEGTNSLLQHLWQDCRCAREHDRGRCGCRHAGSAWRKIRSCANALLHAFQWGGRNARRIPARLPCFARLCSYATGICHCVFQFRQCRHSSHCFWQNTCEPFLEPSGIQVSNRPQPIRRPTRRPTF